MVPVGEFGPSILVLDDSDLEIETGERKRRECLGERRESGSIWAVQYTFGRLERIAQAPRQPNNIVPTWYRKISCG